MFQPDNPLAPRTPQFAEGWHAQALALADTMVAAGRFSAADWATALGEALRSADQTGAPDTEDTYYHAVLTALEGLVALHTDIDGQTMAARKQAWTNAYERTPHGKPVTL